MTKAGRTKIAEGKASGAWEAAIRREQVDVIPEILKNALRRRKGALAAYQHLPDSRKKQFIHWIYSTRREETRAKRIQAILDEILEV